MVPYQQWKVQVLWSPCIYGIVHIMYGTIPYHTYYIHTYSTNNLHTRSQLPCTYVCRERGHMTSSKMAKTPSRLLSCSHDRWRIIEVPYATSETPKAGRGINQSPYCMAWLGPARIFVSGLTGPTHVKICNHIYVLVPSQTFQVIDKTPQDNSQSG